MGWISGLLSYAIIWWLVFFCVLPWGNHPYDIPEIGHASSAPEKPNLGLKVLITSAVSMIILAILWLVIDNGWINFRQA